ncbi:hypothetical protein TRFO_37494 [Tritrichomonas foetus]|uniref:Uncharacterized protein n=1 Tax=Tritrichomonas foetus TaxID=1144522 RepID=A0A1J4JDL7_9EUKA|nr:hypothetical protein TRFO_37494 [Tritrichomonas foetus]|eukprot:OHS96383.1 hypothetical protein TRFO_37494 [Tritrichomonas foetus]
MQSVKNLINEKKDRDPRVRPSFNEIKKRFRKHEIYFEGADKKKVNKYIDSIELPEIKKQMNEIESQLSTNPNAMTIQAISDLVNSLEVEGAPPEVLERCWESLLQFSRNKTQQYAQGLVPFLGTSYIDKAAAELRNLPSGLLNEASMKKILLAIPSGNETVDTNLVITACKNGFSSDAEKNAIHPDNIKLALEIKKQKHVRANKCEQLAKKSIQILGEADPMLNEKKIRCLVSLNKASLIKKEALKISMQSKNGTKKIAAHIAAAQMALEEKKLPLDLIDALSNK